MKRLWMIVAAAVIGSGCADQGTSGEPEAPEVEEQHAGGISLSLTSTDSQGRPYRLRNASFSIRPETFWGAYDGGSAAPVTVLSTETNPDASTLTARLTPGYYTVSLQGDWYIERLTSSGVEVVAQVVLLTEPTQFTYVGQGWNYDLEYRFGVDGTLIDFRYGDLNIDIGIELPGENGSIGNDAGFPVPTDGGYGPVYDGGVIYPPADGGAAVPTNDAGIGS